MMPQYYKIQNHLNCKFSEYILKWPFSVPMPSSAAKHNKRNRFGSRCKCENGFTFSHENFNKLEKQFYAKQYLPSPPSINNRNCILNSHTHLLRTFSLCPGHRSPERIPDSENHTYEYHRWKDGINLNFCTLAGRINLGSIIICFNLSRSFGAGKISSTHKHNISSQRHTQCLGLATICHFEHESWQHCKMSSSLSLLQIVCNPDQADTTSSRAAGCFDNGSSILLCVCFIVAIKLRI